MGASKPVVIVGGLIGLAAIGWYANSQGWLAGLTNGSVADIAIDADDIGGVVSGPNGPEAGVWVIAETDELPTKFVRSVVTDDQGRYVIPDLPDATYQVFSRGYGLIDSEKIAATPGSHVDTLARMRRSMPRPRQRFIRVSTGMHCSAFQGPTNFPERAIPETASLPPSRVGRSGYTT